MWIISGAISIVYCIVAWLMVTARNQKAAWAAANSLSFVALTLLGQYKLVFDYVNKEDWSALMDTVPGMIGILSVYVLIMLLANSIAIVVSSRKQNQQQKD